MNSKLVKGSLAGVACIALAGGGSTFAAFSDFGSIADNSVQAGILKLNLNNQNGSAAAPLDFGNFIPGTSWVNNVWVASSDSASVPNAMLSMKVENLRDFENGCASSSEKVADPNCSSSTKGDGALGGEVSPLLGTDIYAWKPGTPGVCTSFPGKGDGATVSVWHSTALKETQDISKNIGVLQGGQGYCVRIEQYMDKENTGNGAQSDGVKYDLRFHPNHN
jgi:predicted ribosomally synthesized peptide with SipW-like signal peptide